VIQNVIETCRLVETITARLHVMFVVSLFEMWEFVELKIEDVSRSEAEKYVKK